MLKKIFIMCIGVFITISGIIVYHQFHKQLAEIENPEQKDIQIITSSNIHVQNTYKMTNQLLQAIQINTDTVGWIKIAGTKINYPIMHTNNNDFYLEHNSQKKLSKEGAIFADVLVDIEQEMNIVLYGHNMKNGSMFAEVTKYKNKKFFFNHLTIDLETTSESTQWKVFSVYVLDADKEGMQIGFENSSAFQEFLKNAQNRSLFTIEIPTNIKQIVTLVTCSYETPNSRTVVHAYR